MTKILFKATKHAKYSEEFTKLKDMHDSEVFIHDNIIKVVLKKQHGVFRLIQIRDILEIQELIVLIDYDHMRYQVYKILLHDGKNKYIAFYSSTEWHEKSPEQFLYVLSETFGVKVLLKVYDKILAFLSRQVKISYEEIAEALFIHPEDIKLHLKKIRRYGNLEGQLLDKEYVSIKPTTFKRRVFRPKEIKECILVLKCPSCNAALDSIPPCICDICGNSIEFMS